MAQRSVRGEGYETGNPPGEPEFFVGPLPCTTHWTSLMAVAQANKTARIAWALLRNGGTYQQPEVVAA